MQKTFRTSALVRTMLGGAVLGLTLVGGVSQSAYAQQPSSTDASPSPEISANAVVNADPLPQTRGQAVTVVPYTSPSMGGSDIPSNHRGSHGDGKSNS
jgi:hypothetical protein